jgi:hypothetical protein
VRVGAAKFCHFCLPSVVCVCGCVCDVTAGSVYFVLLKLCEKGFVIVAGASRQEKAVSPHHVIVQSAETSCWLLAVSSRADTKKLAQ